LECGKGTVEPFKRSGDQSEVVRVVEVVDEECFGR